MTVAGSFQSGADRTVGEASAREPDLTDADRIRTAVLDCPDVTDLSAGPFGEVASYFPGRTVPGVRVDDDRVEIHIVANYGPPLHAVAQQIARALDVLLAGRLLTVYVDDIRLPGEQEEPALRSDLPASG